MKKSIISNNCKLSYDFIHNENAFLECRKWSRGFLIFE